MLLEALTGDVTFTSLKPCDLSNCTKGQIREYFENSYSLNESIFVGLKDEAAMHKCPDRLRLPLIFYYGHTASVYVNKLILAGLLQPKDRVNLGMETLCETGVDEMSWDDTENYRMGGKFEWPKLKEVVEYRRKVKQLVLNVIDKTPLSLPITQDSPWWGVMMGMEHERIHIETSSVLIRQLPVSMLQVPDGWMTAPRTYGKGVERNSLIAVVATDVTYGKPVHFPSYGWDNEYGKRTCSVGAFEASQYPITNKEFLQFLLDGGYENRSYWSEEGWNWVKFKQAQHPVFWVCDNGCKSGCGADLAMYSHCMPQQLHTQVHCNGHIQVDGNGHHGSDEGGGMQRQLYRLRCMYDVIDMPWDWPVEVNYLEAKAFCCWKGSDYRLLCEAEFNIIRGDQSASETDVTQDIIFQDKLNANINLQFGSSTPVNMYAANSAGFHDVSGNTWEWVEDHFNGLPGYTSHAYYDDFSSPTFDGNHNMILGGSWISTGDLASRFARYAFRRHFMQHCGFRIARSVQLGKEKVPLPVCLMDKGVYVLNFGVKDISIMLDPSKYSFEASETRNQQYMYEREDVVNEMIRLEYTDDCTLSKSISHKVQSMLHQFDVSRGRALHLGTATGYCTFKLANHFKEVLGQDFCGRYINACQQLHNNKVIAFTGIDGFKKYMREVSLPEPSNTDRITFKQLTWLSNEIGSFDFVMSTCFDRVMNPKAWILRLPEVINANGVLVVVSDNQWQEQTLAPFFNHQFKLMEATELPYQQFGKNKTVRVTSWRKCNATM